MASFVTEVLASSGKLEKEDLASKISRMSRKVEDTKEEVCDMMNKKYSEFLPKLQASEDLMQQVDMVSKEMETLKNCIEFEVQQNIHVAVNEYIKLKQQLEKNTVIIKMLEHLKEFHSAMEDFNKTLQEKKYVDAATHLEKARKNVDSLKDWKTSQVPLLSSLSSELTVQRENLIYHLGDEWKRLVIWRVPSTKESAGPKTFHKVELVLSEACSKDVEQKPTPLLCSVLQALAIQGDLQNKIKLFSQVLLKNMLKPLVMYASLELIVSEQHGEGTILGLECLEEENKKRSTPSQVYKKLLLLLKTLHTHLLDVSIGDRKLSAILGELIWEEMSKCIIHDCLVYSIPTNSGELERYNIVIKETEAFEEALKNMEYLQVDSTDLLKYARDVNCHFASKKCRDVIVAARKLMTSKMHNTVKSRSRRNNVRVFGVPEGQEGNSTTQYIETLLRSQLQLPEDLDLKIQRAHRTLTSKPQPRAIIVNFLEFSTKEKILREVWKKGKIQVGSSIIHFDHDYAPEIVKKRREYNAIIKVKGIRFQTPFTNIRIHWESGTRTYSSAREAYNDLKRHGIQAEEPATADGVSRAEWRLRELLGWQPVDNSGAAVAPRAKNKLQDFQRSIIE
uniref:Uncharacterized protein n=1 Tax=Poecilia mexicana TaxID=48701 RepID=A0A3B3WG78_9TELE